MIERLNKQLTKLHLSLLVLISLLIFQSVEAQRLCLRIRLPLLVSCTGSTGTGKSGGDQQITISVSMADCG